MVQHQVRFAPVLQYPVQAAVDAHFFRHVVVLNPIGPQQVRVERNFRGEVGKPGDKGALREPDVVIVVTNPEGEVFRRPPGHDRGVLVAFPAEKFTPSMVHRSNKIAVTAAGGRGDVLVERIPPRGDDDLTRGVRGIAVDAKRTNQDLIGGLVLHDKRIPGSAVDLQRTDREDLCLQPAIQQFDALSVNAREPGRDRSPAKMVRVAEIRCLVADSGPVDVAKRRIEIALDFLCRQAPAQAGPVGRPKPEAEGTIVPAQPLRIGLLEPCVRLDDPAVAQPAVQIAKVHARDGIVQV